MDLNLLGKNALVGGASRGIGKAAAIELAALGANVTLVSRSPDKMSSIIKEMEMDIKKGQDHDFMVADFSNPAELSKRVKGLVLKRNYHILINNTGGPPSGAIIDATKSEFESAFSQHLICNHILAKHLKKGMIESGYGRIINIISTSVKIPLDNLGVSNTIRGAVASWAKTMANELGQYGITVNNILPGATDTERLREIYGRRADLEGIEYDEMMKRVELNIPMRRIGQASEIGAAIAFLASPAASYVNGINFPVDGGRTKCL